MKNNKYMPNYQSRKTQLLTSAFVLDLDLDLDLETQVSKSKMAMGPHDLYKDLLYNLPTLSDESLGIYRSSLWWTVLGGNAW